MRIAKLPHGVEISFPDNVSDKEMDKTVQEFLNGKERDNKAEKADTALIKATSVLFGKFTAQMESLREAIYKLPKMMIADKPDLSKLENSADYQEKYLLSIVQQGTSNKKLQEEISGKIGALADITIKNSKDQPIKEIRNQFDVLSKNIGEILLKAQMGTKKEMQNSLNEQRKSMQMMMDNQTERLELRINHAAKKITDAITAPKELIFDKKTGRPVGVKVKNKQ
jgi:hypothetical protein